MRDDGFTKCDNDDEKKQFATRYVEDAVTRVKAFQPISGATDGNINEARSKYQTELCKGLADNGAFQNFQQYFDPAPLIDFAIDAVYKKTTTLERSGLVIAGYGSNDYFPRLNAYTCYGIY